MQGTSRFVAGVTSIEMSIPLEADLLLFSPGRLYHQCPGVRYECGHMGRVPWTRDCPVDHHRRDLFPRLEGTR